MVTSAVTSLVSGDSVVTSAVSDEDTFNNCGRRKTVEYKEWLERMGGR